MDSLDEKSYNVDKVGILYEINYNNRVFSTVLIRPLYLHRQTYL